jgi:hypothetical protein
MPLRRWTAAALVAGAVLVPVFEGLVHPREFALGHEHAQQNDPWGLLYGLPALGLTTALLLATYGLVRVREIPARAGLEFAIGVFAIAINPLFHTTGWYLISGLVFLAGSIALAMALVR